MTEVVQALLARCTEPIQRDEVPPNKPRLLLPHRQNEQRRPAHPLLPRAPVEGRPDLLRERLPRVLRVQRAQRKRHPRGRPADRRCSAAVQPARPTVGRSLRVERRRYPDRRVDRDWSGDDRRSPDEPAASSLRVGDGYGWAGTRPRRADGRAEMPERGVRMVCWADERGPRLFADRGQEPRHHQGRTAPPTSQVRMNPALRGRAHPPPRPPPRHVSRVSVRNVDQELRPLLASRRNRVVSREGTRQRLSTAGTTRCPVARPAPHQLPRPASDCTFSLRPSRSALRPARSESRHWESLSRSIRCR